MGFLDKIKNTAGSAMAAVSDAAKDVSDKGKEMTERARINKAIKAEETKVNNLYMIIGQKLFNENTAAPAGFEDQFNGIKNAKCEMERLQKELDSMASASSCPKCGAKINPGQPFCQGCGAKLTADTAPAQPVQAEAAVQTETVQAETVQVESADADKAE